MRSTMPRPRVDLWYVERIATLVEEGYKPREILRALEQQAQKAGRLDVPSERAIYRIADAHRAAPDRGEAALYHWPRAHAHGVLPWAAARAALDLLRWR